MDFTVFIRREAIPALTWLGKRDWLDFGRSSNFERRTVWTRPKQVEIPPEERKLHPKELWDQVRHIIDTSGRDVVASFLALALSKSIANGPKIFQPTAADCEALENTACTMAFEDYKQPYPVVIIEFPKEYKQKLAKMWGVQHGPSYVIAHHDAEKGFITVSAFFDRENVISHITPARPEYKTIEDAITCNKTEDIPNDFKAAELAQRLAINFCMVMVLLGVREVGPLDPAHYAKAQKMTKRKDQRDRELGQKLLDSALFKVEFINQKIKLFEEEYIQPRQPREIDEKGTHASPKAHWRKGHYRQQPFGIKQSERKLIFIKPVLVMAHLFAGDISNTQVTYTLKERS